MSFIFKATEIPDVMICKPKIFEDGRGYFFESWNQRDFSKAGIHTTFVQDNQSFSVKNTLRGLHYQAKPYEQAKLVRVLSGSILDCVVDLRSASATFKKGILFELTAERGESLYIPEGFAHGFLVLSENAMVLYKASSYYAPQYERGIYWNDPDLAIDWGICNPILSEKDKQLPRLREIHYDEI
ncbi:MAG: dTDP-4-dehydrorhamnose 3,5-epimerase [Candidatus Marinimicrobia bacterium]|nr:dTDP-4-dehydrorhamnose 3,5-epimerase [Candidatus Neomarinimicrobiota bacterium]